MKLIPILFTAILLGAVAPLNAQNVDEIIANYLNNIGGEENLKKVTTAKFIGSIDLGGMILPIEMIQTSNGYTLTKADVQGQTFYQEVYDGETLWGTNQITMSAEKSDAEATANFKNNINDFPDPFVDYKKKGYTVELVSTETVEGTETYKVKLVKEPIMVDSQPIDDVTYYYFDTESFVPIVMEEELTSGQGKGMIIQIKFSDYQEVEGLYFPFSMQQGIKDQPGSQTITITEIALNGEMDATMFAFPKE